MIITQANESGHAELRWNHLGFWFLFSNPRDICILALSVLSSDGTHRSVYLDWVALYLSFLTPVCSWTETRHNEISLLLLFLCKVSARWVRKPGIAFMTVQSDHKHHYCLPAVTHPFSHMSYICCIVTLFCNRFSLLSAVVVEIFHGLKERVHNIH